MIKRRFCDTKEQADSLAKQNGTIVLLEHLKELGTALVSGMALCLCRGSAPLGVAWHDGL
jgi:hypothetical protein